MDIETFSSIDTTAPTRAAVQTMLLNVSMSMGQCKYRGSAAENDLPETGHGDGEVDHADDEHGQKRSPNEGEIGAAKKHRLREGDKMRRRADCAHHVLQPDGHAFHRGAAAGEQLRSCKNR